MFKKKTLLLLVVCLLFSVFNFVACSVEVDNAPNIKVEGRIYSVGTQEITIVATQPYDNEHQKAEFKESISKKDVKLSGKLKGKTVDSVTYVSPTEIKVTLSGTITGISGGVTADDDVTNVITILTSGVNNGYESFTIVSIYNPSLSCYSSSRTNTNNTIKYVNYYQLTVGQINTLADLSTASIISGNGDLTCSFYNDEGKTVLKIEVRNSTEPPTVKLPASLTEYNQEITVLLGVNSEVYFVI